MGNSINTLAKKFFEETFIRIPRVFLSPFQIETDEFSDFIEDMEEDDLNNLQLYINRNDFIDEDGFDREKFTEEVKEYIKDNGMYGLFAEINIPKIKVNGKNSYDINDGISTVHYLYAESIEELIEKSINIYNEAEEKAKEKFNENKGK